MQRNFHTRAAAVGAPPTDADQADWTAKFAQFIARGKAVDAAKERAKSTQRAKTTSTTFNRPAAYDLIKAVDHGMQAGLQVNLSQFLVDGTGCGREKPLLTMSLDQGPDGFAAVWFLMNHTRLRMVVIADISHREKNDLKLAIAAAGYKNVVDETSVCFSLDYGPWDTCAWFRSSVEAAVEMAASLPSNDPMMEYIHSFSRGDTIWQADLAGAIHRAKVPRLRNSRWFSWLKTAKAFLPHWHIKLAIWMYMGVQMKICKDSKDFTLFEKLNPAGGGVLDRDENAADIPPDLKSMRMKCKSNLYIAAVVAASEVRYNETVQLIKVEDVWFHM